MARRRSKWRKTWMIYKKMMQEARKVRAKQSLHQCPLCGNPHSLSIEIKENKRTGTKTAYVHCSNCGLDIVLENLPSIVDEFWVYSRVLDEVQKSAYGEVAVQERPTEEVATVASEAEKEVKEETSEEIEIVEEIQEETS